MRKKGSNCSLLMLKDVFSRSFIQLIISKFQHRIGRKKNEIWYVGDAIDEEN
jgi:hypothetical protein